MNSILAKQINEAANYYNYKGPLEPGMIHLIEEEGFVPEVYEDDVGVKTEGVGATAENKGKNFFTEVYPKYEERAARKVKGYTTMPQDLKNAILSAVYRGDLGPKTAKLLSKGQYAAAAEEYLDHKEYKERKEKNPDDGVVKRMERNAAVMRKYAEEQAA
jgi:GH24 family phage-related lysozyme (muramidase)